LPDAAFLLFAPAELRLTGPVFAAATAAAAGFGTLMHKI
jgi:hypothetical protein